MASGKKLLLLNAELTAWWVSVKNDPRFDALAVHVRSEIAENASDIERLKGGLECLELLQTITDNTDTVKEYPASGLVREVVPPKEPFHIDLSPQKKD